MAGMGPGGDATPKGPGGLGAADLQMRGTDERSPSNLGDVQGELQPHQGPGPSGAAQFHFKAPEAAEEQEVVSNTVETC